MTREEAIKTIRTWDFLDNDEKEVIETLIPELKESEDERFRKEILSLIRYTKGRKIGYEPRIHQDKMIAWLEKQREKKFVECSEEDKEQCNLLIWQLANLKHTLALNFRNEIKWLQSLKQRLEEQQ